MQENGGMQILKLLLARPCKPVGGLMCLMPIPSMDFPDPYIIALPKVSKVGEYQLL